MAKGGSNMAKGGSNRQNVVVTAQNILLMSFVPIEKASIDVNFFKR